jgi:hypothetical protein
MECFVLQPKAQAVSKTSETNHLPIPFQGEFGHPLAIKPLQ